MIVDAKNFFNLLRVHHKLPPAARPADLAGRLAVMATGRLATDPTTRRCLGLFLARRVQPSSSSNQGAA